MLKQLVMESLQKEKMSNIGWKMYGVKETRHHYLPAHILEKESTHVAAIKELKLYVKVC